MRAFFLSLALLGACNGEKNDTASLPAIAFSPGFSWGVSVSAFQTEGGASNDYTRWIAEGGSPEIGLACDSWNRWSEDLDLAVDLGVGRYRMSVEWSRVEPERGAFDDAAIQHYREVLLGVRERGMEPLVTLHHFTNPLWFADEVGWTSPDAASEFAAYASYVGGGLGDLVDDWNPVNEPMVYIGGCALAGIYPGCTFADSKRFEEMFDTMLEAHAASARALRKADTTDADGDGAATSIWGVAAISPAWAAIPGDPDSEEAARRYDEAWNHAFVRALVSGDVSFDPATDPIQNRPELAGTLDIMGINYYSRVFTIPYDGTPLGAIPCTPPISCGEPNDLAGDNGNEVYPPGIHEAILEMSVYGLPMVITENGIADATDAIRPSYLVTHLIQVDRAIQDGYDVRGYFQWSLLDNYEWSWGYEMKFGLYEVDFATGVRTPRPTSVPLYGDIVTAGGITEELVLTWDLPEINQL